VLATISSKDHGRETWIAENAIFPFLKIEDNLVRYYPESTALGQITGFVDGEGKGRYGVEGYFESELQGESPVQYITKDISGSPIRDYASSGSLLLKNGIDITLTIDRNIQKEISKKLESAVTRFRANRGSAIVMDPKTGAIIAMANYPNYDPNNFTSVYDMEPVLYVNYPNPSVDLFGYPLFVIDSLSGTLSTNIEGKRIKMRDATEAEVANFAIIKYKFKNGFGV
jgi:cell division protein FtsI/penicillin-binding protein 2